MPEAIIFDIGNVLLRFDFSVFARRVAPFSSAKSEQFDGLLEPLKIQLESGRINGDTFLEKAARSIGFSGDPSLLRSAWQEIFTPIEATHALVERLHNQCPLFLLSNTNDLHAAYFLARYPVFGRFRNAVYSHECGLMKPDASIYRHALEKFNLRSEQVFFIDDLYPNVEAARASGWRTHHYREDSHKLLLAELESAGAI